MTCTHRGFWYMGVKMKNIAIKEHHLYNKTFSKGKRFVGKYVAVYVLRDLAAAKLMRANPQREMVNRLGLSVSKKLGGAVARNRAKRVMRAGYDTVKDKLLRGNLIVISPRSRILDATSVQVGEELYAAFSHLGLMENRQTSVQKEKP